MRTKYPIDMKQTTLEREFHKLSYNMPKTHHNLILSHAQIRLVLPWHLTNELQMV